MQLVVNDTADISLFFEYAQGPQGLPGPKGATGPTGPAGPGVAAGGTTWQVLAKASENDYDTQWITPSGGGGLQYLTEVRNTTAPNATVPVHGVQAAGTETDIDLLLQQKGTGAILAQVPDGTTAEVTNAGPTQLICRL